ncbi:MAG: RNA-binding transcriptional accessory protein [Calditrichaeota bacterium]|nr:MAG: RNA-binding transcriptional accessory protein [Calditrichota bacterium]
MTQPEFIKLIAKELVLKPGQVSSTVELLDDENTVPFIARYRKEATGGLDEEQIRAVEDRIRYLRILQERKETVRNSIEEQGKLTAELQHAISTATKLQEVEDLYLPYKPKRRTRATIAKEKGLELLAERMFAQTDFHGDPEHIAAEFIDAEKGVATAGEALAGARDIIAEQISDTADFRKYARENTWEEGELISEAKDPKNIDVYEIYAEYRDSVKKILAYRVLAINRGERDGFLRVKIAAPDDAIIASITKKVVTNDSCIFADEIEAAVADGYSRLIAPAIEREVRNKLTELADAHAIKIFSENLRNLLMQPPVKGHIIMGIDPAFRTGCKIAVIDGTGKYLDGDTIYPHQPQNRWDFAKIQIKELIEKYDVTAIAIGNGTASRETEQLVAETIGEIPERELQYIIVNEAGASVYSASPLAKEEFPDLDAAQRGNISIARRLLDPLAELVKIDPKSIGVGLYQHDVNQTNLVTELDRVVESAVNNVGVNLNTASVALLNHVAGIRRSIARNIVEFRNENGQFRSRNQLLQVKGLGPKVFTQCAGFLRIPDSDLFFDSTAIHPESYETAEKFLQRLSIVPKEARSAGHVLKLKLKSIGRTINQLAEDLAVGLPTLQDILEAIEKPERDPRDAMDKPIFRSDVLKMEDLQPGMMLKGTVRNVVDFGAFVDIGVKQDGLVHISKLANRYVKNPMDVVSVGDVVDVKIISIDAIKGRISLSMLADD